MKRKLKYNQFFVPSLVLLLSFIVVLVGANIGIKYYVSKEVDSHIENKFSSFNLYIDDEKYWDDAFKGNPDDFLIPTEHVILDESNNFVDSSFLSGDKKGEKSAKEIAGIYIETEDLFKNGNKVEINIGSKTYYVQMKSYFGYYDGYVLFEPNKTKDNKIYKILVFSDVSPIERFTEFVNRMLICIMVFALIISLIIISYSSRKMSESFRKLKEYIYKVGKREKLSSGDLAYEEFNEVIYTVDKMAKMIEEAEESQKTFFQNASHELRTPLMSIQGYAEAIKNGIKNNNEPIDIILRESRKMSSLVDDILVLSKLEDFKLSLNLERVDINELIYACSWSLKPKMDERSLSLEFNMKVDHIITKIDEGLIERAILNLLSNAIRYADSKISVELVREESSLSISIKDDGGKIESDEIEHIFERFYNGKGGNFGIGLALVKEIVDLHEGNVEAKVEDGNTEFILSLPLN